MENIFMWVLIAFPIYLLIKGRLTTYMGLATAATTTAATS